MCVKFALLMKFGIGPLAFGPRYLCVGFGIVMRCVLFMCVCAPCVVCVL